VSLNDVIEEVEQRMEQKKEMTRFSHDHSPQPLLSLSLSLSLFLFLSMHSSFIEAFFLASPRIASPTWEKAL
jgi:hypothetical protein